MACVADVMRAKAIYGNDERDALAELEGRVNQELDALEREYLKQG